jgi:hypothetical protein
MPWYPKEPADEINHYLKNRFDSQHQLKDKLYPRQMRHAELPLKSQIPEDPGQQYDEHESLTEKEARLQEEFAVTQHTSGFQKLMESQPEDFWIDTPQPTQQEIREDAKQAGWWQEPFEEPPTPESEIRVLYRSLNLMDGRGIPEDESEL